MLDNLETLVTLSETGTMAQAATELGVTQSAVSKRIAALEAELGAELLERVGRRAALTPRALELVQRTRPLLAELKGSLDEDRRRRTRSLSLGVSESVLASWGPRLLSAVQRGAGGPLSLALSAHHSQTAIDLVQAGEHTLALVAGEVGRAPELSREALLEEPMVLLSGHGTPPTLRRGQRIDVISLEPRSATWRSLAEPLRRLAKRRDIRFHVTQGLSSSAAVVQLARAGFGTALVPLGIARAMGVGESEMRRVEGLSRPVSLLGRKRAFLDPAITRFVEEATAQSRALSRELSGRVRT